MKQIGWIGLGNMGMPMAINLVGSGYDVIAYNRSEEKSEALVAIGAQKGTSPKEVVEKSDIIFFMLSDADAIGQILTQSLGVLESDCRGKVFIDMSTISPSETKTFAKWIEERGGKYIDAPVSGSVGAAKGKSLLILAGGDRDCVELYHSLFMALGREVIYFGETGKGSSAKLTINLLLGIMTQGFAEVLYFGERIGLDKEAVINLISKSAMNNGLFQAKKDLYLAENFPPAFMLELMSKDLGLAQKVLELENVELPLANSVNFLYREAKANGIGGLDMSAIYLTIKSMNQKGE